MPSSPNADVPSVAGELLEKCLQNTMKSIEELEQRIVELEQQHIELMVQFHHAQRLGAVGQLASSVTHEFNNILTTVINYAKMGLRHKDAATRDKAFDRILSAGQRAAKITSGMLAYARAKGERRDEMDLSQIVADVLVLVEKDLQMHRIKLQTDVLANPVCEVCVSHLQQVLMNLIVNARQAMETGGMLTIGVRLSEDKTMGELSVKDTGPGIPSERLRQIFEPFFSTKTSDANGQGGTGLGLSFCKDVIEAHKGRLRVESTVGQGTIFTLKLPLAVAKSGRKSA